MKYLKFYLPVGILFVSFLAVAADDKYTVSAHLKSVTIYRSGAELTHDTKALLVQGNNELVIDGVSNGIDINSIQIKVPSAVTIAGI